MHGTINYLYSDMFTVTPIPNNLRFIMTSNEFTCRKCRLVLFSGGEVAHAHGVVHSDTDGTVGNVKTHWGRAARRDIKECTSVFTCEAPDWVGEASTEHSGVLNCPKCSTRVGNFNWSGATCSCGRWVAPAFQFPLSKIDRKVAIDLAALSRTPETAAIAAAAATQQSYEEK